MALKNLFRSAFIVALWFSFAGSADYTANKCFNPNVPDLEGTITISCPENFVISVEAAFFGGNEWGACVITDDDCREQTNIFHVCDGLTNCTRTFKTFTRTCGYSSMLVLGYSCIRALKDPTEASSTTPPQSITEPLSPNYNSKSRYPASVPKQPQRQSDPKDKEEIGLIIGCALASFITVVFLIIAIVMVIRRLLEKDGKVGRNNSPNSAGNCGSVCITMDCLPCFGNNVESPRKISHDLRMRKKTADESSTQSDETRLRVAPIGEESIAKQGCSLSKEQDSTSSSSSLDTDEMPPTHSHHCQEDRVPATIHSETQKSLPNDIPKQDALIIKRKGKKEKFKRHSSINDLDNENTLPSSSNRNLMSVDNDISSPMDNIKSSHVKNMPGSPKPKFDAIALPNTQTLSSC